jgi:hypothetical protein
MDFNLLDPLVRQLEKSGDTSDIALARVLELSNKTSKTLENVERRLTNVESQTTITNGRVTTLEKKVVTVEEKQTDDSIKLHSPLVIPIAELQKEVKLFKQEVEFHKRIWISASSIAGTLFVVFGATWWDRFVFLFSLDKQYLITIVTEYLGKQ